MLQLAFKNANKDCKQALWAIQATKTLGNYLKTRQDVVTEAANPLHVSQGTFNLIKHNQAF